jgi:hypothetical protein
MIVSGLLYGTLLELELSIYLPGWLDKKIPITKKSYSARSPYDFAGWANADNG